MLTLCILSKHSRVMFFSVNFVAFDMGSFLRFSDVQDFQAVYRGLSWWFRTVSEQFRPITILSLSRFQFLSLKHCRCWFENFLGAYEGDEGKLGNLHTFNAAGPHISEIN